MKALLSAISVFHPLGEDKKRRKEHQFLIKFK